LKVTAQAGNIVVSHELGACAKSAWAPFLWGGAVDEVTIDMVGLELFQVGIQESAHVHAAVNHPGGELGSQLDLFAIAIGQRLPQEGLALPRV
jgi:hypothetical protein